MPVAFIRPPLTRVVGLTLTLGALWSVLAANTGWGFGSFAVIAAVVAGLLFTTPSARGSGRGLLRFIGYFLRESLIGAVDVARRAFHPTPPLRPTLVDYPLRLPAGPSRSVFALAITLLPGTLSADLRDGRVVVHALDPAMNDELPNLEQRVADLFALELDDAGGPA